MKLASNIVSFALLVGIAVEGMSIRGNSKHADKLLAFSRRLEESGSGDSGESEDEEDSQESEDSGGSNEEDQYSFLKQFSIKLISCIQGEQVTNYENGEMEFSTVIFRLCPSDSCDSSESLGCDEGYGDYAVGINTFMDAYMESQRENEENQNNYSMIKYSQWGQQFDASEYMECKEYEQERDDEEQQQYYGNQNMYEGNYYEDMQFFIGPACSEDGTSVALKTYMDEDCSYAFQGNFSSISPGWDSLPFSDGGLISMDCVSCYTLDEDYNVEVSEMCQQEYESSFARCEPTMVTNSSYHYTTTAGCDYVDSLVTSVYGESQSWTAQAMNNQALNNTINTVKNTVSDVSTKFMDTMSSKEARAFIAGMVIFGLSFFIGVSFIACLCVKKRRKRRVLKKKEAKLLLSGSSDDDISLSIKKRRSSVVALVRTSTNNIKESVVAAATGTKVAVATAAAATVAAVTKNPTKESDDDSTIKSEYNNMEEPSVETSGSYKAPEASQSFESTPKTIPSGELVTESVADESEEPVVEAEETKETKVVPASAPNAEAIRDDDTRAEESVTASEATEKTRGSRFLSKMDKHLKKKLSVKPLLKKK